MTATSLRDGQIAGAPGGRYAVWRRNAPRLRLLACGLFLAALPFATAPGDIIADTKFELAVNPSGFLSGALTLWNPQQFGVLLNQAVGYLFPMGPFFELLRLAGADGWVVQRLWLSALLLAAFGGTVLLTARIGAGTPATRLAAGLAYALSPMALSMLGQTSGEFLPMALMPWIIVPLASQRPWLCDDASAGDASAGNASEGNASEGDASAGNVSAGGVGDVSPAQARRRVRASRARAVARSAVAVGLCSGMNAASTIAVMLPAFGYIVTRPGRRTRVRMLAWWVPAVLLVTSAWSVPLVLLSKYGVSIVPYTESAQVTASTTSLLNVLRGTENWVGYQATNGQPDRPLAFLIATAALPALLVGSLAVLGLAGLVHRGMPERRFLLWSVLGGVMIISLGYVSALGSPLEGPLTMLINGPASPFRNLWKFDPMIRLPLAVGLAYLLAATPRLAAPRALAAGAATRRTGRPRVVLAAAAAVGLGALAVPALSTGLASPGSFSQVPAYWTAAAGWLTAHAGQQAVLVEPGAAFGEYTWGSPMDDVLQGLTNVDWAGRNLETVGSVGNERLLDAIDQQFSAGDGSAGLTAVLARTGVKYVVVRNDLAPAALDGTSPARIHDAIAASGGMTLAAQFGPAAGGGTPDNAVADFDPPYPAVQVYQVAGAEPAAVVQPAAGTLRVGGAPESLITLANAGLLGSRPVLVNGDGPGEPVSGSVDTDSLRRQTVNFGELRTDYTPTLTAGQPANTFLSTDNYTEPDWSKYLTVAQYSGISQVTASSSSADITANSAQWSTGTLPYAAFDGNAATMWESGAFDGPLGQWIQADFQQGVQFGDGAGIQVAFADNVAIGPPVTRVELTTAAGSVTDPVRMTGNPQALRVPAGATGWLRITVAGLDASPGVPLLGTQVGIASIAVPGISASRTIVTPPLPGGDPSAVVLAKAQPYQSSCMLTSARWVCAPQLSNATEEQYGFDHAFGETSPEQVVVSGSATITNTALAEGYALPAGSQASVTASSTYTGDPQDQPRSAFDGSTATSWIASPADPHPELTITWGSAQVISQIKIERPPGASGPAQVLITGSTGQRRGAVVGASGVVSFAPMKTTSLSLTFTTDQAPLQISDVLIPGVKQLSTPAGEFRLPCGLGPQLTVDGQTVPTGVTGTVADLLNGRPLRFTACLAVSLTAGTNRVTESATQPFDVRDVVLERAAASGASASGASASGASAGGASAGLGTAASPAAAAAVMSWTSTLRTLRVNAPTRSYLEVNENFNAGWQAVIDGRQLPPVRLDGWKQAWVLPAGTAGTVTLTYRPESVYRLAVAGGLAALALVIVVALTVPRRRSRRPLLPWPAASSAPGPSPLVRRPAQRWLTAGVMITCLAVAGLVLGGYPGAVLLPGAVAAFCLAPSGWRLAPGPWLLGGLLTVALLVGALGEHLQLSGHSGPFVTAAASTVPQIICLVVVGGLVAVLLRARTERGE